MKADEELYKSLKLARRVSAAEEMENLLKEWWLADPNETLILKQDRIYRTVRLLKKIEYGGAPSDHL